jgi:hypothetical protein
MGFAPEAQTNAEEALQAASSIPEAEKLLFVTVCACRLGE